MANPLYCDTISTYFNDFCIDLKLNDNTFHDLRRTYITECVKKGIDSEELRLAVGHSNIQTTCKYYVMDAVELEDEVWTPEVG